MFSARWIRTAMFAAGVLTPAAAYGQSGSGVISGIVQDASGAAVPGASVSVTNEATKIALESVTNDDGLYRVGALVPGVYRIDIRLSGFQTATRRPLTLSIGQTLTADVALALEGRQEAVTVTASVPAIETQGATVGQVVTREMLAALPLPNRAASSLVALAPGVVMIDTGSGTAENYPVFSVAGGRARNQNFLLDGGNASNAVGLTRAQQLTSLPVDAMQEFRVISNNYAAEFGHSTGGIVAMSTRAGGNDFHGTAFESFQDAALDARNFFAARKPPLRLNQFGGTAGGPIQQGKTFFFASWERTRQLTSDTIVSTVPTLGNRRGDFSDLQTPAAAFVPIYDPLTRQPFPGNAIPLDRIDPVALAALAYYPEPNRAGTAAHAGNYAGTSESTLDRDIILARVDYKPGPGDLVTARYYINDSATNVTGSFGNPLGDPLADSTDVRVQSVLAAHTHIFGPRVSNELRATYLRRKFIDRRPGLGADLAAGIGLGNVTPAAFPVFTIPGYSPLSSAAVARIQTPIVDTQVLDSVTWTRGTHAYKFGGEFRSGANDERRDRGSSGVMSFSPLYTSNAGAAGTGNALATFLLGAVNSGSVQISDQIDTRAQYAALFAQDDWRVTSRLTVSYGLRYDVEFPRRERDNRMNSFDPIAINPVSGTPGVVTFAGVNGTPGRAFRTDWNNAGPRVGLAYQLGGSHRTVLRGGAGVLYGQTVSATIGDVASLGFSTSASFVVAQAATQYAFLLRDGFPAYSRPPLDAGFGAVPVGQRTTTSVAYFDPSQVAPTSYQSTVSLQHELRSGLLVEAGYVGNESRHLTGADLTLNQVPADRVTSGNTQLARPYPQFSNVTLINPSIGRSSYHSAFVRAQKRLSDRFSLLAHYTWSRFYDDVTSTDEYGSLVSYMDAYHRELDWAPSGSDVPQHFVATVLYEVGPFASNRYVRAVTEGWRIGALVTLMSGPPFTVTTTANTTNAFPAGPLRPDLVGDPNLPSDQRTLNQWFNTASFVNPAPLVFGNSPRSVLRGPGLATTDLTLEKTVPLGSRVHADLRVEAFNLFNHANFNAPGSTLGSADFGVISSARPARAMQVGVRLRF
jgi:Carboxypeptidase regulatory-like domain/TonB-dependent Receptor Plug Domain